MILGLRRPRTGEIQALLAARAELPVSYRAPGAPAPDPPRGYRLDRYGLDLGSGRELYLRACSALRNWRMFAIPGVEICWPTVPLEVGRSVAVLAKLGPLWSVHPSRIVSLVGDAGPVERFGFCYATLPGHAIQGEERFSVEWSPDTDRVRYEIVARSRPAARLLRVPGVGLPWVRRMQRRFGAASLRAMQRAVDSGSGPGSPRAG